MRVAGVVAALTREAQTLGPVMESKAGYEVLADGTLRAVSGMGCAAAGAAARRLLEAGAEALISWGVAGALDPQLEAGAICLPREVVGPDGSRYATAAGWRDELAASIAAYRPVAAGALLTRARPVAAIADKATLHLETGAVAVDMESSAVAHAAALGHVPFVAVRVIVDTARDAIPLSVTAAGETGEVRIMKLLAGLIRFPGDIAGVMRLARRYGAATRSLRVAAARGPLLPPVDGRSTEPPPEGRA